MAVFFHYSPPLYQLSYRRQAYSSARPDCESQQRIHHCVLYFSLETPGGALDCFNEETSLL
ncbi:UNVERIFIED_CONTAM: hypothetical protein FKN15_009861 [Acipenser sinensis]